VKWNIIFVPVRENYFGIMDDSGHGGMWQWVEWAWLNVLEKKNKELKAQRRKELSRYNASDCSFRYKEFEDWSVAEQIEFTDQLIRKVFRHPLVIVSYTLDT
jgi:hypothetical protein